MSKYYACWMRSFPFSCRDQQILSCESPLEMAHCLFLLKFKIRQAYGKCFQNQVCNKMDTKVKFLLLALKYDSNRKQPQVSWSNLNSNLNSIRSNFMYKKRLWFKFDFMNKNWWTNSVNHMLIKETLSFIVLQVGRAISSFRVDILVNWSCRDTGKVADF